MVNENRIHLAVECVHDFGAVVSDVGLVAMLDFEGDGHGGLSVDG